MMILRAGVGFMFFLIAFYLKQHDAPAITYGLAVAGGTAGTVVGNYFSPLLRSRTSEGAMLRGALALAAGSGVGAALLGGVGSLVLLAFAVNLAAAIGRMGFESLVQHRAPSANVGQAFARFETRFQLAWALGGLIPVVIVIGARAGALVVTGLALVGVLYSIVWPRLVATQSPVARASAALRGADQAAPSRAALVVGRHRAGRRRAGGFGHGATRAVDPHRRCSCLSWISCLNARNP